jgi:plasmid stabilization system protein ParE
VNFRFHPEALEEFEAAADYYADIQPALGLRFTAHVEVAIRNLVDAPLLHAILEQDIRRCLAQSFPYAVLYALEPDYVLIVAVMHCRREPGYWRHRIPVGL